MCKTVTYADDAPQDHASLPSVFVLTVMVSLGVTDISGMKTLGRILFSNRLLAGSKMA